VLSGGSMTLPRKVPSAAETGGAEMSSPIVRESTQYFFIPNSDAKLLSGVLSQS
jgi:hypothetical protein